MKLHGEWMHERRRGSITFRWDFYSWGIGVHGGAYLADWMVVGIDECYQVAWVKFSLGPCDLELARYGPGRKWPIEEEKWIPLRDLRKGAIFEAQNGKIAIKTAYNIYSDGNVDCYQLANGKIAYVADGDNALVKELSEEEWEE